MEIIGTIVIGFLVGVLARFFTPGRDQMGVIATTLLGIVGAWLGSWIGQAAGFYARGEPAGFLMALLGALVVLFIFRQIQKARLPH